jgi:glycerate 2-kinase
VNALASPASLKGVLSAREGAAALAEGFRAAGAEATELPVADGGEGTIDAFESAVGGERRSAPAHDPLGRELDAEWLALSDGTAVVEAAAALGLPLLLPAERDPLRATSRGLGELLLAALDAGAESLVVGLGGVATVDGGAGMLDVAGEQLRGRRILAACDVRNPLLGPEGAARVFGPQKGARPEAVDELERRLAAMAELAPYAELPGAGAAGGLGAGLASVGAELVPGAELVLDRIGFRDRLREADLVVTGEGMVDRTTFGGKAPGAVVAACQEAGVRCVLFGGVVAVAPEDVETRALSGDRRRARDDLVELGRRLGAG